MHRIPFHLVSQALIGLFVITLLSGSDPALAREPVPKGTLSGRVVGPDGKPIADAHVWVDTYGNKRLAEVRTDAAGRFCLEPVDAVYRHRFPLFIEAEGFARHRVGSDGTTIFPGANLDVGTIVLVHGRRFTGQVLDVDGKPKVNTGVECSVWFHQLGHSVATIGPNWKLITDADGRFRTPPLPVGELVVIVRAPDRQVSHASHIIAPDGEESLEPIRLVEDVPISGFVQDERGRPVAGAEIRANYDSSEAVSDAEGRFVFRGFGPNPRFQMQLTKKGYVFVNWSVVVSRDGFKIREIGADDKPARMTKNLSITLQPVAWMDGRAADADTGEPVRLKQVVLCHFDRGPNGEIVRRGCRNASFEQPENGRFRIAYSLPDEYHLTFSANGYEDAEVFTPKVTELKTIEGIAVKLKKKTAGTQPAVPRQRITGAVTSNGRPVTSGWVGLWALPRTFNVGNAFMLRGRIVTGDPVVYASAPIRDGRYSLDVPFQDKEWYVVVEEPGQSLTQIGPIAVELNSEKKLDIACTPGGSIAGRVQHVPEGWRGNLWVVAFNKTGIRYETRVEKDGSFLIGPLPRGEFGLKVGHDAYDDPECPRDPRRLTKESWDKIADPWKLAKIVNVGLDRDATGIELELPATEGPH